MPITWWVSACVVSVKDVSGFPMQKKHSALPCIETVGELHMEENSIQSRFLLAQASGIGIILKHMRGQRRFPFHSLKMRTFTLRGVQNCCLLTVTLELKQNILNLQPAAANLVPDWLSRFWECGHNGLSDILSRLFGKDVSIFNVNVMGCGGCFFKEISVKGFCFIFNISDSALVEFSD